MSLPALPTRLLAALLLLAPLPASLGAEVAPASASSTAAAGEAPAPEAYEATVVLKDGQQASGKVARYDAFFLELVPSGTGKTLNIPWREVLEFRPSIFTGDSVVVKQYLSSEAVEVGTRIQAKDPGRALKAAFWPGFLLHGAGYREGGDVDMFYSLAGAELFGALVGAFGFAELGAPEVKGETKGTAQALAYSGLGIFAITWAWDLLGSGYAARAYNSKYGLALTPRPEGGAVLAAGVRF